MRPFSLVVLLLVAVLSGRLAHAQNTAETETVTEAVAEAARHAGVPPPAEAFLLVTVNVPGANIVVDEGQTAAAPASALRLSPGTHTLQVSSEGYDVFEQSIQVPSEGARVDVFLDPSAARAARMVAGDQTHEPSNSSRVTTKWWFWAAIGGGAVVIAGVVTAIVLASGGDGGQEVIPVPPIPGSP